MLLRIKPTKLKSLAISVSSLALAFSLVACGGGTQTTPTASGDTASPSGDKSTGTDKLALASNVNLIGAGASFPAPLYQRWFGELTQKYPKLQIDYQSVGSGAGVERFTQGLVDFGASDVAMKDDEIAKVTKGGGVLMLPMTAGSIVLAYNLPGVDGELKLSREVYADIFLGKITKWNDPKIAKDNPELKLPDKTITVVYRSDGSGTTGVFTAHLSAISKEWKDKVGEGKTVNWPSGIGANKNDGVTAQIAQNEGALGYVEYGFAKSQNLKTAALQNKDGKFVAANDKTASASLAQVELPANLRAFITDPPGPDSYPIVSYSWMLVYKKYDDANKAKAVEAMIEYGLTEGQKISDSLGYIPLPDKVIEKVIAAAQDISPEYKIEVGKK